MNNLIKLGAAVSLALSMPVMAQEAAASDWTFSGNLTATSDYVFRGISLSSESPAFQPSFNVGHSSGLYGYVWGSNVDFDTASDGISTEVDYGLGWSHDLAEGVNLDLLAARYTFPGSNKGFGIDYNEYIAKVTVAENYFAMIGYADNYAKTNKSSLYYQVGASWGVGETGVTFAASAGYNDFDNVAGDSFYDFRVGFSRDFGPVNLDLSYIDTAGFSGDFGDPDLADSRLVLTASFDFDL